MPTRTCHPRSSGRSQWALIAFLCLFVILLIGICHYYLFPALEALKRATPEEKTRLRAWSALLLALVLVILICGLLLTVRIGRFFFPRPTGPQIPTKHVDAWAESGRRLEVPPTDTQE